MTWTEPVDCLCLCNRHVQLEHTAAQLPQRGHRVAVDGIKKRVPVTRYAWIGSDRWELAGGCSRALAEQQRAFGEGQFLVALTGPDSYLHTLLRTAVTDPPELALAICLTAVKNDIARDPGLTVAIAFNDEEVEQRYGAVRQPDLAERCQRAVNVAAAAGVHLAEWIQCSPFEETTLGARSGVIPHWWDVPGSRWEQQVAEDGYREIPRWEEPERDPSWCPRCSEPPRWRAPMEHGGWPYDYF